MYHCMCSNYLFKLLLFFLRVGVIKPHDQTTFELELVVLVEEGSLGMTDMQIPTDTQLLFNISRFVFTRFTA